MSSPTIPPAGTSMASTSKPKGAMLDPLSKKAPRFDRKKPAKLRDIFETFKEIAKGCSLDAKEKSKAVVRYMDDKTKWYWKTLDGYDHDLVTLKQSIEGTYSKTELEPTFLVKKLAKLGEKSAKTRTSKDDQLSKYTRKFGYLLGQLQAANKLSDAEKKEYFWKGLHPSTQKKIRAYLEIHNPALRRSEYPSVKKVLEAGMFLFLKEADGVDDEVIGVKKNRKRKGKKLRRDETSDEKSSEKSESESSDESESSMLESSEEERKRKKKGKKTEKREVKTRKVKFGEEKRVGEKGRMLEIDELTKQLHGLKVDNAAYMTTYTKLVALVPTLKGQIPLLSQWVMNTSKPLYTPQAPCQQTQIPYMPQRPADHTCHFCKATGHHCRGCPIVAGYN
jgi:hypothetical protein